MKRIWETIGTVIITAIVVAMMIDLIKPYVGLLLLGAFIVVAGEYLYTRFRNW